MEKAGANVRRVGPDIPRGTPDEVWLEIVGKNNWIALSATKKFADAGWRLRHLRFMELPRLPSRAVRKPANGTDDVSAAHQVRKHERK